MLLIETNNAFLVFLICGNTLLFVRILSSSKTAGKCPTNYDNTSLSPILYSYS